MKSHENLNSHNTMYLTIVHWNSSNTLNCCNFLAFGSMWVIAVLLVLLTLLRGVYYSALTHLLANLSPEWQTSNIFSIIGGLIKVWHFPFTECNLYCHLRMLLECARIVSIAALYFRACILLSVKLTQILAELFVNSCHFYPLFTWRRLITDY